MRSLNFWKICAILALALFTSLKAEDPLQNICGHSASNKNDRTFKPDKKIKGLIVYAAFLEPDGSLWNGEASWNNVWPENSLGPIQIMNDPENFVLPLEYDLNNIPEDNTSITHYFKHNSNGKMTIQMDTYPIRIDIKADSTNSSSALTNAVFRKLKSLDSDLNINTDWSKYDNYNNSTWAEGADHKPDYIMVIFRNNYLGANGHAYPGHGTNWLNGLATAWSRLNCSPAVNIGDYTISSGGFTYWRSIYGGIEDKKGVFIHETGHQMKQVGVGEGGHWHVCGNNYVVAERFHAGNGESIMSYAMGFYSLVNAAERYRFGFEKKDIDGGKLIYIDENTPYNNPGGGYHEIELNDFATTREAAMIKIPNLRAGEEQYLWLEFHKGEHVFDKRMGHQHDGNGNLIPQAGKGLLAYLEQRREIRCGSSQICEANYTKVIHAEGNYDFSNLNNFERGEIYWNNPIYDFQREEANPYSYHNISMLIRNDFYTVEDEWKNVNNYEGNPNGIIDYSSNWNAPPPNKREMIYCIKVDGEFTWGYYGNKAPFTANRKVGISSNPALVNRRNFNSYSNTNQEALLHGLSFEIVDYNQNSSNKMKVRIRFNDFKIKDDLRMCCQIISQGKEITLAEGKTLRIDKSKTPERQTPGIGGFVNQTVFEIKGGGSLTLEPNSIVKIENGSELKISNSSLAMEANSKIEVEPNSILRFNNSQAFENAEICLKKGSKLILGDNADLTVGCRAQLNIAEGAEIIFGKNSKLILNTNAELTAIGSSANKIKFKAENGKFKGIVAKSNSSITISNADFIAAEHILTGNSLSKCVINKVSGNSLASGILLNSTNNFKITKSSFRRDESLGIENSFGIRLVQSNGLVKGNTIRNFDNGIVNISSTTKIYENIIHGNQSYGVNASGFNSIVDLGYPIGYYPPQPFVNNSIRYNKYGGAIYLGGSASARLENGHNNLYYVQGSPVISKETVNTYSPINAENNYWGTANPSMNIFSPQSPNWIDFNPYSAVVYPLACNSALTEAALLLAEAALAEEVGNYSFAKEKYLTVIRNYPNSKEGYLAMANIHDLYLRAGYDLSSLENTYQEKLTDDSWESKKFFDEMIVKTRISSKQYDHAITKAESMKEAAENEHEALLSEIDIALANSLKEGKANVDNQNLEKLISRLLPKKEKSEETNLNLPKTTMLFQNYPNPFNPKTSIKYDLATAGEVKLVILDINGQKVKEFSRGMQQVGSYEIVFDATKYASGTYFYQLRLNEKEIGTKKMMLIK